MTPSTATYDLPPSDPSPAVRKGDIESRFIRHTTGSSNSLTYFIEPPSFRCNAPTIAIKE